MAKISLNFSEIIQKEKEEEENQKALLDIAFKITDTNKKIIEIEGEITSKERELNNLQVESTALEIQSELQVKHIKNLKSKVAKQMVTLQNETKLLDEIQHDIYDTIEDFIEKVNNRKIQTEMSEVQDFIKMYNMHKDNLEVAKENWKLQGEVDALKLYNNLVQKQNKSIEHVFHVLKEAGVFIYTGNE